MSPPNACAVNEGTTLASALMRSVLPADWISVAPSTCTGEELVYASSPLARVPVTMTVSGSASSEDASASATASWACTISGVQANGASSVDLISQISAPLRRLRFVPMNFSPWLSSFIHRRTRRLRPIARE
jgi:hypothetical protein